MRRRLLFWEIAFCLIWVFCASALAVDGNGKGAVPPPKRTAESTAEATETEEDFPFEDVAKDSKFFDAVKWAVEAGITRGTSDYAFSPDDICTQKQILIMIWRAAGKPEASCGFPYANIDLESEIGKALRWAYSKDLEVGELFGSQRRFDENRPCTRVDAMRFIWTLIARKADCGTKSNFVDVTSFHPYVRAVVWAVSTKITNGTDETHFSPDTACLRKHIAKFLYMTYKQGYLGG